MLNLNDIDWIEGEIHVRAGKSRCERTLPLLEEVGKALGAYLRQERPEKSTALYAKLDERSLQQVALPWLIWAAVLTALAFGMFSL